MTAERTVPCAHCNLPVRVRAETGTDQPHFCCAGCRLVHNLVGEGGESGTINLAVLRLGLGLFLTMNVMAFSYSFYGGGEGRATVMQSTDDALHQLFQWLLFFLSTCVMVILGTPIATDAIDNLRQRRIQSTALITLGAGAAYILSVGSVVRGTGHLYFDSACMVLTLVTVGEYLEGRLKQAATLTASSRLAEIPSTAIVLDAQGKFEHNVPSQDVTPGSIFRVPQGNRVPVDGIVIKGTGLVSESMLTGEALPRAIEPASTIWAGSILLQGAVWGRATSSGAQCRIEQIRQLLDEMRTLPPRIQNLTNRASAVFVPVTVLLAVSAFFWVLITQHSPAEAILRGLSVTLIACPCALGLAAPLATWMTGHRLASRGIIVRSGNALENGGIVRDLFLDKTGTLTSGQFRLESVRMLDETCGDVLSLAAGLEQASTHPISSALRAAVPAGSMVPEFDDIEPVTGLGVRGRLDGSTYALGRTGFPGQQPLPDTIAVSTMLDEMHTVILWRDTKPIALFGLTEQERPDIEAALQRLRQLGLRLHILTGDTSTQGTHFATRHHLPITASLLPDGKRRIIVEQRHSTHRPIGFVGDGVNDAPALSEADLGIAVHTGSDLAQASGDVILLGDSLTSLGDLFMAAREARRRIYTSLLWAFAYNAAGLTLAFMGVLRPAHAAIAMIGSSMFIIWNSTRGGSVWHEEAHEAIDDPPPTHSGLPPA